MPPKKSPALDELERSFADGGGPRAIALVGDDGYLVAEAHHRLKAALEKSGPIEFLSWDGSPARLADELRTGSLFGTGSVFVLDDPEWLVTGGGDGKRRLASLVKSAREGKANAPKRLVDLLVARGAKWDPEDPADAREALRAWLAETEADDSASEAMVSLVDSAVRARVEASEDGDPVASIERALEDGIADGNRMILLLGSVPPKTSRAASLLARLVTVSVELPPGDRRQVLARMAEIAAKESGIRLTPPAAQLLLDRTAPSDRPEARSQDAEGSIRLFRSELDKLLVAAGPGGTITPALVDSLVDDRSAGVIWDLDKHLASREIVPAINLVRQLLRKKRASGNDDAMLLLGYLAGQFRKMVAIHKTLGPSRIEQAGQSSYASWKVRWLPVLAPMLETGRKDFPLFKATQSAASFTSGEVERALVRIAKMDRSVKSGGAPLAEQLEGFLLAVIPRRGREAS